MRIARRSILGTVQAIRYEKPAQNPVVGRINEDTIERHCLVAETMDKEGFELTLQVVHHHHPKCGSIKQRLELHKQAILLDIIPFMGFAID